MKGYKSVLIKDTTREEREEIVRRSLSCESGCENCSGCALGVGDPFEMYKPYIEGRDPRYQSPVQRKLWNPLNIRKNN